MTVAVGGDKISMYSVASLAAKTNGGQYLFAVADVSGYGTTSVSGARIDGVIQNKVNGAGQGLTVQINGVSKLLCNGTVAVGDRLRSDANGGGTTTATNLHESGAIALEAGASGAYIAVLVTPGHQLST